MKGWNTVSPEEIRNLLERVLFHEYDAMRVTDEEYREALKYIRTSSSSLTKIQGGPWTRHGHAIPGVTVAGSDSPARVARCGGPSICTQCAIDAATEQARLDRMLGNG